MRPSREKTSGPSLAEKLQQRLEEGTGFTHDFYATRAYITQRLIEEKGFSAVIVEADWPDADRINRYVRGPSGDTRAVEALADLQRFPRWMPPVSGTLSISRRERPPFP